MILDIRIDLNVPYAEKDEAKALGARWDRESQTWYAPSGTELGRLNRWLPRDLRGEPTLQASSETAGGKGVALTELLARIKVAIDRGLPEAVWVRAEISQVGGKNGNLYLNLAERNERGDILAQAKGIIWRSRATDITAKFEKATGEGLHADIKILCLARVRFDILYGLDLIIEDVDPSYTLGDLAAKLARIREQLQSERIYDRNKGLPAPVEFVRVAVISPETSAGLGDFRRESDRLHHAGLCEFVFFHVTFQGTDVAASIGVAIDEVMSAHRERRFDVLVIIRGGGSVTDLAWLNDLEVARSLCHSPIPVFTGIGHERDNTILDEIAHRRFDTPSKVALHITQMIRDNAIGALTALEQIRVQVGRILTRERTALANQVERIETSAQSTLRQADDDHRKFMVVIRTATHYQLREAGHSLEAGYARLIGTADQTLCEADLRLKQSMEIIAHRSQLQLGEQMAAIEKAASAISLQAQSAVEAAGRDLRHHHVQIARERRRWLTIASDGLVAIYTSFTSGANSAAEAAKRDIETFARIVVGLGPHATLRRGFAIARDSEDRPITSRESAMRSPEFSVEFHDGSVPVVNRSFEGGSGR